MTQGEASVVLQAAEGATLHGVAQMLDGPRAERGHRSSLAEPQDCPICPLSSKPSTAGNGAPSEAGDGLAWELQPYGEMLLQICC
jgi:hypothetical protein